MRFIILCLIYFGFSEGKLWPKGVVHYAINPKDYDPHSRDEIVAAFSAVEKEVCVKFFSTPLNHNSSETKVLFINNPDKQKNCPPQYYNFTGDVVNMPIGYKCLNKKDIARMAIDMLKASIQQSGSPINSFDLVKRFKDLDEAKTRPTFLTTEDRNYINAHYLKECSALSARADVFSARRLGETESGGVALSDANAAYYLKRAWPLGVVMYSVDEPLRKTDNYRALLQAMTQVELATCVMFHETDKTDAFSPINSLVFREQGADEPELGFKQGQQVLNLAAVTNGAPGHTTHALNNLLRALGVPMMSNRFDRDNYLSVMWPHVQRGKERLLEKTSKDAWVVGIPYDFRSVTHAPTNYLCGNCVPGQTTVAPLQDFMWKHSLEMGHNAQLSDSDKTLLNLIYSAQCKTRFLEGRD